VRIILIKKIIISLLFLCLLVLPLNSQLRYNFENGNLDDWQQSKPGRWEASLIQPITGLYSLHQIFDNSSADNDQISHIYPQQIDPENTICWSFRIRHTYNPSSANNWAFFLTADHSALNMFPGAQINGIIVGVNFTGSDDLLKIWKIENGSPVVVLQSTLNWETTIADSTALIRVERTPDNNWNLKFSANGNQDNLKTAGTSIINFFPATYYFGIYYKYSSSQDQKLWIDDISIDGSFITDTVKPQIDTAIISESAIELQFNKPVDINSVNKNNFIIKPSFEIPDTILLVDDTHLKLVFPTKFSSGDRIALNVSGVKDLKGNVMLPSVKEYVYYIPSAYDVIITEIMADPDPPVGLPPYEYIELYNRSDYPININKWGLIARNYFTTFLSDFIIPSKSYLILCSNSVKSLFEKFGTVLAYDDIMFLLTNAGTNLMLLDSNQNIISFVNYSDNWYNDDYKKSGGWSLEMIDPMNPCGGRENWAPSIDKSGGTPGRQNSVWATNPDNTSPELLNVNVPNDSDIILHFSEPLYFGIDSLSFFLNGGIGYPDNVFFPEYDISFVTLNFKKKLEAGKNYELHIKKAVCDCVGNTLTGDLIVSVVMPQQPDSFDVVINEVLFNSFPNGSEFVELYNRSDKIIDAGSLLISLMDTISGLIKNSVPVAGMGFLFFPKTYLAITGNIAGLEKFYQLKDRKTLIEQTGFPSLPDDHGIIALRTTSNRIIDQFNYSVSMHFALLASNDGVSLERLQPDNPTNSHLNWHSAAQSAGYATPGYTNSQLLPVTNKTDENIIVEPEVFTPDNDGHDDFVTVTIKPDSQGSTATINIFNSSGMLVRHLVGKQYLGSENNFTWDGTSDNNKLEPPGIYIIYALLLSENGKSSEFKKACVLGRR